MTRILRRDATKLGEVSPFEPFTLAFCDPPYGKGLGEQALVSLRAGNWLAPDATLVLEESADVTLEVPEGFVLDDRRLYGAAAVHFLRLG